VFARGEQKRVGAVDRLVPDLARLLICVEPQSRIPTVRELADTSGASVSSVHQALGRLERAGAIGIERRGRNGSYLARRSLGVLWAMAAGEPLVVALPLAASRRYEALATAIKMQLVGAGLDTFLIFMRGSRQRLRALREGRCHLAVMSAFAASDLCGSGESVVLELPPDTFNTGHRVFHAPPGGRPLRVLVDRDSVDQQAITLLEFQGTDAEFVPANSDEFPRLLERGHADAAVWTLEEMQSRWPSAIVDRPLSDQVRGRIGDADRRAALVVRSTERDVLAVIARCVDADEVQRVQTEVLARRMTPEY
jgi:hypothetical protein